MNQLNITHLVLPLPIPAAMATALKITPTALFPMAGQKLLIDVLPVPIWLIPPVMPAIVREPEIAIFFTITVLLFQPGRLSTALKFEPTGLWTKRPAPIV